MTTFVLRPYQQECLEHAKTKNTIVNLPTGFGKTLIAARLIDHFLHRQPNQRIAFLVPTRALVEQQSVYCAIHCRLPSSSGSGPVMIQRLEGTDQKDWIESDWEDCLRKNHILLGTAALFQQAFVTDRYMDISRFSLIVFDECHNACGNSPMAAVMRDAVAPYMAMGRGVVPPRVLGLTASFINGSLKNMDKSRRKLEALLLSTIICPNVAPKIADEKFKSVPWKQDPYMDEQKQEISLHVEEAVQHVGPVKEATKVIKRCEHVFEELGLDALQFYIEKVIVDQVVEKANLLKQQNVGGVQLANRIMNGLPNLHAVLDRLLQRLNASSLIRHRGRATSLKLVELIKVIEQIFLDHGTTSYRGIVFVEQAALVSCLAKQLNDAGPLARQLVQCGAVAGTGYQSDSDRQMQLDKFKLGTLQLLVSTAALEEGIDVSACAFVIRYTSVPTTKAHIQGAGRARHRNAMIYYFANDPQQERQKEAAMTAMAKKKSLALTPSEFQSSIQTMNRSIPHRHPYPSSSTSADSDGQVNVYNCKQIFNQYCSMVLGTTIQPQKVLYRYTPRPAGTKKILSHIRYPTPNGWQSMSETDYRNFWKGIDLERQVFVSERVKKKSASDKEEMCFVYVIVVELRQQGYLDCHNRLNASIRFDTKRNCLVTADWSDAIGIKNSIFQSYK